MMKMACHCREDAPTVQLLTPRIHGQQTEFGSQPTVFGGSFQ